MSPGLSSNTLEASGCSLSQRSPFCAVGGGVLRGGVLRGVLRGGEIGAFGKHALTATTAQSCVGQSCPYRPELSLGPERLRRAYRTRGRRPCIPGGRGSQLWHGKDGLTLTLTLALTLTLTLTL